MIRMMIFVFNLRGVFKFKRLVCRLFEINLEQVTFKEIERERDNKT